jgi:glycine cleavage system regulatory protein
MRAIRLLTVIGEDRPGLVESLAAVVTAQGGNWLESRMARLGGQFAGIVRVEIPEERAEALARALAGGQARGVQVTVTAAGTDAVAAVSGVRAKLSLVGHDRPGIVRDVTGVLARHGANVEELVTGTESAAMSGDLLFRAEAEITVPTGTSLDTVRAALEAIAADLMVDVDLTPAEAEGG